MIASCEPNAQLADEQCWWSSVQTMSEARPTTLGWRSVGMSWDEEEFDLESLSRGSTSGSAPNQSASWWLTRTTPPRVMTLTCG